MYVKIYILKYIFMYVHNGQISVAYILKSGTMKFKDTHM